MVAMTTGDDATLPSKETSSPTSFRDGECINKNGRNDELEYKRMKDDDNDVVSSFEHLELKHTRNGGFVLSDTRLCRAQWIFAGIMSLQIGLAMLKMYLAYRRGITGVALILFLGICVSVSGVCVLRILVNRFHPQLLQVKQSNDNNDDSVIVYKDNRNVGVLRTIWSGTHQRVEVSRLHELRLDIDDQVQFDHCAILATARDSQEEFRLLDADENTARFAIHLLRPFVGATNTKNDTTAQSTHVV